MQNSSEKNSAPQALELKDVAVRYPSSVGLSFRNKGISGFWALKNVTFSIQKGDVLGVIGANGAGKSTTLKVISGIISPDRGTIQTHRNKITLLSLNAGLSPYLSGRKNILLIGLSLGLAKDFIYQSMKDIIQFSELDEFIDNPVLTYSSGMRARLGFAASLFLRPDIILIDETLGVGDRSFNKKSSKAIQDRLAKDATAIIVSHGEGMIRKLCNKVLWLEKGETRAFGAPKDVLKQYDEYWASLGKQTTS